MTSGHINTEAVLVTGTPKKKHRPPSDLRRDANRVQNRIEKRLTERTEAWATGDGRDDFLVSKQDGESGSGLKKLHHTKRRVLANDVTLTPEDLS